MASNYTVTIKNNTINTLGETQNQYAFAVIKDNGSVVTWGDSSRGGDSRAVAALLDGTIDVTQIFSSFNAFAALRADGSVVTWGASSSGTDSSTIAAPLDGTIDVTQVFSSGDAFAALRADGSIVTWGAGSSDVTILLNVTKIIPNNNGFAALRSDGSVIGGGSSSVVTGLLNGTITQIISGGALSADGSVVSQNANSFRVYSGLYDREFATWEYQYGYSVASQLDGTIDVTHVFQYGYSVASQRDGTIDVTHVFSAGSASAALRADGSVVTWGYDFAGGEMRSSSRYYHPSNEGEGPSGFENRYSVSVASQLDGTVDVVNIYPVSNAFAALRSDGSVVTWGHDAQGGNSGVYYFSSNNNYIEAYSVKNQLDGTIDVTQIFSTGSAFAALRADGSVVSWGDGNSGGDSRAVAELLDGTIDVTQIFSTVSAFAALRADGSVVTWGASSSGGDSRAVAALLDGTIDVTQIYASAGAFAALRSDGSMVTWGASSIGGDSSVVATQLTSGVANGVNVFTNDVTIIVNNFPTGTVNINDIL